MAANQVDQCHYISPAVAALGAAGGYGLGAGLSALAGGGGSAAGAGAGTSGSGGLTGAADDVAGALADDVASVADDVANAAGSGGNAANPVDDVIQETLSGADNFVSGTTLSADDALTAGERFVGSGYSELGRSGSGVFRSADGLRGFRMDSNSLQGLHRPNIPHVHLETFTPNNVRISNNHIPFID